MLLKLISIWVWGLLTSDKWFFIDKTVTLFYVLSHVPLSKYHRPTHHHLSACVAWNPWCVATVDPQWLAILIWKYTLPMLMSHLGYTWWCHCLPMAGNLTRFRVTSRCHLRVPFCQVRSGLKTGCNAHIWLAVLRNQTSHLRIIALFHSKLN